LICTTRWRQSPRRAAARRRLFGALMQICHASKRAAFQSTRHARCRRRADVADGALPPACMHAAYARVMFTQPVRVAIAPAFFVLIVVMRRQTTQCFSALSAPTTRCVTQRDDIQMRASRVACFTRHAPIAHSSSACSSRKGAACALRADGASRAAPRPARYVARIRARCRR